MKWFSLSGIFMEIKRIRWSSPKTLAKDSSTVLFFMVCFSLFFILCTLFNASLLQFLGV